MLDGVNKNVVVACFTAIILAILAAIVLLAWASIIPGSQAIALIGGIVAFVGSIFGVHTGFQAGTRAASVAPTPKVIVMDGKTVQEAKSV